MKDIIKKYLMVVTMAVGVLFSAAMPALAYTGSAEQTEANSRDAGTVTGNIRVETEDSEDEPITEEPTDGEESEDALLCAWEWAVGG